MCATKSRFTTPLVAPHTFCGPFFMCTYKFTLPLPSIKLLCLTKPHNLKFKFDKHPDVASGGGIPGCVIWAICIQPDKWTARRTVRGHDMRTNGHSDGTRED